MEEEYSVKTFTAFPKRYMNIIKPLMLEYWLGGQPESTVSGKTEVLKVEDDGETEVFLEEVSPSYIVDRIIRSDFESKGLNIRVPEDLSREKVWELEKTLVKLADNNQATGPFLLADERRGLLEVREIISGRGLGTKRYKATFLFKDDYLNTWLECDEVRVSRKVPLEDVFTPEELERIDREGVRFSYEEGLSQG